MDKETAKGRRFARLTRIREKMAGTEQPFIKTDKIPASDESAIYKGYGIKDKPKVKKPDINKA